MSYRFPVLSFSFLPPRALVLPVLAALALGGCDHSPFDRTERGMDQAEQKMAARDFPGAVNFYEQALDGTGKTSEAHFRMGLIYSEKLSDPVQAVSHFRRYLELSPNGTHVKEAQSNLKRLELTLATNLAGGTLISHTEAMKIKADNADLRKQLAAAKANAALPVAATTSTSTGRPGVAGSTAPLAPGSRTYQVQAGDTLASISRKFYKTKVRAKDIQDANMNSVPDVTKLRKGQTLIIP